MIVSGLLAGYEVAHRIFIDRRIEQRIIVLNFGRVYFVRTGAVAERILPYNGQRAAVNACFVFHRRSNEIFRVDSTADMDMQVGAFWHAQ